jgi:hypothetical protein
MKLLGTFLLFFFNTLSTVAQSFDLKPADSQKLRQQFEASNYQELIVVSYLKKHYKATSGKRKILYSKEMGGARCGYTLNFKGGIQYTYLKCQEEAPVVETITFPKVETARLQKWIENIEKANPSAEDTQNIWYKNENEFGPKDEGVGCYYKILPSEKNSIVEISCGC